MRWKRSFARTVRDLFSPLFTSIILAQSSFICLFLVTGGVVATCWHSVSSSFLNAVWDVIEVAYLCISDCALARHLRDEAARAGWRCRCEAECVRCAWAQSCRLVHRAVEFQCEYVRNGSCHRGEGCRHHRGGVWNQAVVACRDVTSDIYAMCEITRKSKLIPVYRSS